MKGILIIPEYTMKKRAEEERIEWGGSEKEVV